MPDIQQLKKHYRSDRLMIFVGAGASMSVCWTENEIEKRGPSWTQLVDESAKQLGFSEPELARVRATDLQILEYFKRKNGGQTAKLTNWFTKNMDPPDGAIQRSKIHNELVSMDRVGRFYTTNFDNFIERSFDLRGRDYKVVALERDMCGSNSACQIVKFHGDIDHPEQLVLTESDYEKRLSLSTAMDYKLRADLLGSVVLFLGYSFRDANISYLFRLFSEQFLNRPGSLEGTRAYIIVPDPSDIEYQLFGERNMEVLPVSFSSITDDIARILREIRS